MNPPTHLFHDLKAGYLAQQDEVDEAVRRVLHSGWYILGKEVKAFEEEFASWLEVPEVIGTGSATESLQVGLLALGVGPGDDVCVPSLTAAATAMAAISIGARVIFVDIDPSTMTMCPDHLARSLTPRTKVVIPVHLYGQCADMDAIFEVVRGRNIEVFEDASQSHGARYKGRRSGGIARLACFSFYPTKNLGAYGDGGALSTTDRKLAEDLRRLRNYGFIDGYDCFKPGINARLDEVHAAILRVKLKVLDRGNIRRAATAARYAAEIQNPNLQLPAVREPGVRDAHVWHQYVLRTKDRDNLRRTLRDQGIETLIHYPRALHRMTGLGNRATYLHEPLIAAETAATALSLPIYPEVPSTTIDAVIAALQPNPHHGTYPGSAGVPPALP